jgi:alkanesulfonate monooxygenase SsuD/methylene tetrahydromethanopterin reductase-like flavin-dependent oxidoreductase (luciferase family)
MRFAVDVPNFGDFADPRVLADLARRAEQAGWDGLFVWDHITHRKALRRTIADPWVLLTAAALATERIRLGTMITPVARRRVQKLAREVTTLDRLTGGRMILGVGLGAPIPDEFGSFGETTDRKELAARLDEGLTALDLLWSGEPVTFRGEHVVIEDVRFCPLPCSVPEFRSGSAGSGRPGRRCGARPAGTARCRSCCPATGVSPCSPTPRPSARSTGSCTTSGPRSAATASRSTWSSPA